MSPTTLVYTKLSGTLTSLFCCTVILQSTGGSLHVSSSSLGHVEENRVENGGKAFEHNGGGVSAQGIGDGKPLEFDVWGVLDAGVSRPLVSDGSGVLSDDVSEVLVSDDGWVLPEGAELSEALVSDDGDVLTEGTDVSKPLVSDDGGDLSDGDSDGRSLKQAASGVDDRLRFKDDSANGDPCLRFLSRNIKRQRRVLGTLVFCDFAVSDDDDDGFRLGDMGEDVDASFLFLL